MDKSRSRAQGVRDPGFRTERINLVDRFEEWFDEELPAWPEVAARLRSTPDADTRRLFKDLVSARWCAAGLWKDWDQLILAVLADATALDYILGRLFGEVIRRHRGGTHLFPDDELLEAVRICRDTIGTSRPWEVGAPAYG